MKVLDKITLKELLRRRKNCTFCLGKGYLLYVHCGLDATKFREVRPCVCVRQVVRIDEEK